MTVRLFIPFPPFPRKIQELNAGGGSPPPCLAGFLPMPWAHGECPRSARQPFFDCFAGCNPIPSGREGSSKIEPPASEGAGLIMDNSQASDSVRPLYPEKS